MEYKDLHSWNLSAEEAVAIQNQLRTKVIATPINLDKVKLIAGCDISFNRGSDIFFSGIVVLSYPALEIIDFSATVSKGVFPYIPGLLSFRETPALLEAWKALKTKPDVVFLDGQGFAHPRRFGIASHFGLLIDLPTIGCAKSILVGKHRPVDYWVGAYEYLTHYNETVGSALRTKEGEETMYISAGHLSDLHTAMKLVLRSVKGFNTLGSKTLYRMPEPTRLAHELVNAFRKGEDLNRFVESVNISGGKEGIGAVG